LLSITLLLDKLGNLKYILFLVSVISTPLSLVIPSVELIVIMLLVKPKNLLHVLFCVKSKKVL